MAIFVSCWHCKRPVLTVPRLAEGELVALSEHLELCDPDDPALDDPFMGLSADHLLRHFRVVAFEEAPERAARHGERQAR